MERAGTIKLKIIATVATVQAQPYDCGGPERTVNALANAVMRVAPMFMRARETGAVSTAPPSREQWKQQLLEQGRAFCARYPDDAVCGNR